MKVLNPGKFILATVCIIWMSSCNNPKDPYPTTTNERTIEGNSPTPKLANPAEKFAQQATSINLAIIEMADLAEDKATAESLKQWAKSIKNDHEQMMRSLDILSNGQNWDLPDKPYGKDAARLKALKEASNENFDQQFGHIIAAEYDDAVQKFGQIAGQISADKELNTDSSEINQGKNQPGEESAHVVKATDDKKIVKEWARANLGTLRDNLNESQKLITTR